MRDQDVDFACITEEGDELRPLRLRYGVTPEEATHREPLDVALSQEEADQVVGEDGTWDEVEPERPMVVRSHPSGGPDDLDEERVSTAAEQDAMHNV